MKTFKKISSAFIPSARFKKWISDRNQELVRHYSAIRIILVALVSMLGSFRAPGGELIMTEEMRFQAERGLFYYQIKDQPFSEDLLKKAIYYERIKYQDIVLLQSQLETGHYTSDIFLNGHNLFGMKYPERRPTVATGTYKEHAKYAHWSDSVIDYALWQEWYLSLGYRIGDGDDSALYLVFLKSIPYARDPRYVPKLVEMSQRDMT
jgi:hypothetical protein